MNILGSVAFYANNNCTGTAIGNVTAGCDVSTVSFAAPAITAATTYSAQYLPPASVLNSVLSGSACSNGGCVASGAVSVVTGAPGTPAFTGSQSVSEGGTASTYTVSSTNSPTGYTWTLPANWGGSTTGSSLSLTPPAATYGIADGGNNVITVSAANVCGSTNGTYTVYVHGKQTWQYSGNNVAITVPVGITTNPASTGLAVQLWGAGGGSGSSYASYGGAGGYVAGTLNSTYACSGCTLNLLVGQGGQTGVAASAYGGGGIGPWSSYLTYSGNGGGRTTIRNSANNADVVTAGAGGGGGYDVCSVYGGGGGGLIGGTGGNYGGNDYSGGGGGNTTTSTGGAGGCGESGTYCAGAGTQYLGGNSYGYIHSQYVPGGGGGGGYYGGGGGGIYNTGDGAGGGSSYVANLTGTPTNTQGGNGSACPVGSIAAPYTGTNYVSGVGVGASNYAGTPLSGGPGEIAITW